MATAAPTAATWTWPPDVLAFAAEQGATKFLEPMLEMTRRVFPNARKLSVCLEEDWEIANERWIAFEVQMAGLTPDQYVELHNQWSDGLFEACPAPQVCTFVLALDILE
ncbi:MAG TPA: hypothetical protein VGG61_11420 [Gemmataceae bacterium]|jgi:hypothetical protein